MFRNYLRITFRHLKTDKGYFAINQLGLIIGIASFILIAIWIRTEMSYDRFHPNADNIYRIDYLLYEEGILEQHSASGSGAIGKEMKKAFPEVKEFTRFTRYEVPVKLGDRIFREKNVLFADISFFKVFSFPLVMGKADSSLLDMGHAVITEETAKRYFGDENPLGKILNLAGETDFMVTGVVKSIPSNSHIRFDILLSYENLISSSRSWDNSWVFERVYSYVLLFPGTDSKALEAKLPALVESFIGKFMKDAFFLLEFKLTKLTDIHLHSSLSNELEPNGSYGNILALGFVAFLVLLIAFINYVNLATSRSLERAQEVGIRKITGAGNRDLLLQFITESASMVTISLIISFLAIVVFSGFFSRIMDSPLRIGVLFGSCLFVGLLIAGTLFTGFLPALYISRFSPGLVLKGKKPSVSGWTTRLKNSLVVFQFTISVILIICTIIIYRQISFMRNHDPGFSINELLVLEGPLIVNANSYESYMKSLQSFKDDLNALPGVLGITASSNIPGTELKNSRVFGIPVEGRNTEKKIVLYYIDNNFFETYGIKLLAGNNFEMAQLAAQNQIIVNESALSYYGFPDADHTIGKLLRGGKQEVNIRAVAKDFNQLSLKDLPRPIAFFNFPANNYYTIRADLSGTEKLLPAMRKIWDEHYPDNPFSYFLLKEFYDRQYRAEMRFSALFITGSVIAILIACMGLFGLSAYSISRRTKEIGIRKSTGAGIFEIIYLLNRNFLKWVLISVVLSVPVSILIMERWLGSYPYRTEIKWWIFILAGIIAFGIALATVSLQSWKAAAANPVESLRYE